MNAKALVLAALLAAAAAAQDQTLDPAAWGSNHAGQDIPDFPHGDECLFCHRNDIGPGWQKNAHGLTVRQREDAPNLVDVLKSQPALASIAPEVQYFLGSRHRVRFLKKAGYGRFAILSTQAVLGADGHAVQWIGLGHPTWDKDKFAGRCAGCHATAVDQTKAFQAFGLDCYTCHGAVSLQHTGNTSLIWLSKKRRDDAPAVTSICAQCHLRTGRAKSSGLPYPNNFVAGDNLFQDYQVDLNQAGNANLNPGDRHIYRNVRDVALHGSDVTCLSCHKLHDNTSRKHRFVLTGPICQDCHNAQGPKKVVMQYVVHSEMCEY